MKPVNRIAYYSESRDPNSADTVYHGLIGAWTNTATGDRFLRFPSDTGWSAVVGGTPFDLAVTIHAATGKTTPVDADEVPIWNSVGSVLGKVTWANIVAALGLLFGAKSKEHDRLHAITSASDHTFPAVPAGDFLRDDGTWAAAGGGGHTIEDGAGTDMTDRTNLQLLGDAVTDDAGNDRTIAGYTMTLRQWRQAKVASRRFLSGN